MPEAFTSQLVPSGAQLEVAQMLRRHERRRMNKSGATRWADMRGLRALRSSDGREYLVGRDAIAAANMALIWLFAKKNGRWPSAFTHDARAAAWQRQKPPRS